MSESIERCREIRKKLHDMRSFINRTAAADATLVDLAYEYAGEADPGSRASHVLLKLHNDLHDALSVALDKTRQIGNITARARDAVEESERRRQHGTRRLKI